MGEGAGEGEHASEARECGIGGRAERAAEGSGAAGGGVHGQRGVDVVQHIWWDAICGAGRDQRERAAGGGDAGAQPVHRRVSEDGGVIAGVLSAAGGGGEGRHVGGGGEEGEERDAGDDGVLSVWVGDSAAEPGV